MNRKIEADTLDCETKGWIRKGGKGAKGGEKIYIIIDDKIKYFISIKSMKNVLEGKQEMAAIRGYDWG